MSKTVIKVENLSKQYRLGQVGTGTLSHDLNRWWHRVRGKEDPYLKIGETNDRATKGQTEYVWALKDINFEVQQGEVLGIIGKNGAGKSTLLKILSKVTGPTTGSIKAKGRIASLLEVGTGFHPELTGRENIYLNGTILGMTKAEVKAKLDEIVAFAGVERYLDTPVKRYSSGMMVRLGFAVAAHLEPEILIVDEVLAVGDAEFQKKAIGKMQEVSTQGGRTVLFVSHNMGSVQSLCNRCLLLHDGQNFLVSDVKKVISEYQKLSNLHTSSNAPFKTKMPGFSIENILVKIEEGFNRPIKIKVKVVLNDIQRNLKIGIGISNSLSSRIATSAMDIPELTSSINEIEMTIKDHHLPPGNYSLALGIDIGKTSIFFNDEIIRFSISSLGIPNSYLVQKGDRIGAFLPSELKISK